MHKKLFPQVHKLERKSNFLAIAFLFNCCSNLYFKCIKICKAVLTRFWFWFIHFQTFALVRSFLGCKLGSFLPYNSSSKQLIHLFGSLLQYSALIFSCYLNSISHESRVFLQHNLSYRKTHEVYSCCLILWQRFKSPIPGNHTSC